MLLPATPDPKHLRPRIQRIQEELFNYREQGLRGFATSSFQSNSVVLLHLIARFWPTLPVWFLNTGFHFPETLSFRRGLAVRFGLDIRDARSPVSRAQQRDASGRLLFTTDPDHCCHLNKVLPLDPVIAAAQLWINGVRASQSAERAAMAREGTGRGGIRRYHPLIDWTGAEVEHYLNGHDLPRHPLEEQGYGSVGCEPCTRRPAGGDLDDRSGRWSGQNKTECGLHVGGGS